MELRQYLSFIRRRWWLILLGPIVATAAAYGVSKQLTPIYRANATLLVVNQTGSVPGTGVIQLNDILTSERLTNTYVKLVERRSVLQRVVDTLKLPITVEELDKKISVSAVSETQLLRISVEDHSPRLAADIANTTATEFINDNARELGRPGTVSIAEAATAPQEPAKPDTKLNVIVAGVLGLLVSAGLALGIEYLDDTIKTSEDIETLFAIPTLGMISRFRHPRRRPKNREEGLRWVEPVIEDYRDLRTNVHFANIESNLKTIVVTSHGPGEGKSTTAANLAMVLAQAGDRVILVDTDLRRPSLHEIIGAPNSFGLTGLLLSDIEDPTAALFPADVKNMKFLSSGPVPPNPSELLTSKRMARVVRALRDQSDFVIFDSPPLSTVSDASVLAAGVDGVLLVVEAGRARAESLKETLRTIGHVRSKLIGAVLNKQKSARKRYGYYGYSQQVIEARAQSSVDGKPAPIRMD